MHVPTWIHIGRLKVAVGAGAVAQNLGQNHDRILFLNRFHFRVQILTMAVALVTTRVAMT